MKRRDFVKAVPAFAVLAGTMTGYPKEMAGQQEMQPIILPTPVKDGGKTLLAALAERKTNRSISPRELPTQEMSNLLWAAFGVNRDTASFGKKGRTAPSASNSQEIDLYVALSGGIYLYEAVSHRLMPVAEGDFRSRSGRRGGSSAPLHIFYIVDTAKYDLGPGQPDRSIGDPGVQMSYYYTDTGFIAQNVYLYAAAAGLAAWFHNCDKENTVREFNLKPTQKVLFAQTVGYPG